MAWDRSSVAGDLGRMCGLIKDCRCNLELEIYSQKKLIPAVSMLLLSRVGLFANLWTVAHQAPMSMGFFRQEYWSWLHFLLEGIFLIQGSNPPLLCLLHCRQILYQLSHWGPYAIKHNAWQDFWVCGGTQELVMCDFKGGILNKPQWEWGRPSESKKEERTSRLTGRVEVAFLRPECTCVLQENLK